ncbi:MAG: TRAP transporter small permease subunit [Clostridia bacterium]|nr:TRAP transporter small permease subunit [Clostridia bacterium]
MKKLANIGRMVEKIYMGIGAAAMGLLALLVIFTVIMRYCFALSWKEMSEFCVTLFAFTTFWGMGINVLRDEHVSINILYDKIKPSVKRWICVINCLIMLAVDCVFVKYAWDYTMKMGKQISMGMEIPMMYMYGIMPVCGVICALCIIVKIVQAVTAPVSHFEPKDTPVTKADN